MRNIELKARLADLNAARKLAESLATKRLGVQHQVDTYFHCYHGRLKLRQIDGLRAELIAYTRENDTAAKASDYHLTPLQNPETIKRTLALSLGIRAIVEKHREVFLYHNVRIHLDDVIGLGHFLEFEAVLANPKDEAAGHALLDELSQRFLIQKADLLPHSYGEMILQQAAGGNPSTPV